VLELLQVDYRTADLEFAESLADALLEHFAEPEGGGFYFTSNDHEALFHRSRPAHDSALPSGNAVAAFALQRLGHLTGHSVYLDAAEGTLQAFYPAIKQQPTGFATLVIALEEQLEPPTLVVLRGAPDELQTWRRALAVDYRPATMLLATADDEAELPPLLGKPRPAAGVEAYVCRGVACLAPVSSLEALRAVLQTGQIQ
jgi:uncharacterized protein YyaL (SSP411 family)